MHGALPGAGGVREQAVAGGEKEVVHGQHGQRGAVLFASEAEACAYTKRRSTDFPVVASVVTRYALGELGSRHPVAWYVNGPSSPSRRRDVPRRAPPAGPRRHGRATTPPQLTCTRQRKVFKEVREAVSDRGGGVRSRGEAARKGAAPR
jgi:hypothetical protein